jgi:hypothetical protein
MAHITVKGLDQLKREMSRLTVAVQTRVARNTTMAMAASWPGMPG